MPGHGQGRGRSPAARLPARIPNQHLLPPPLPWQLEAQKRAAETTLRRAAYTAAQLDEMPEDVLAYRQVGKA